MRSKLDVLSTIPSFNNYVQKQFVLLIKCSRLDNGLKFKLNYFFTKTGIVHQLSYVETPQQNEVVEHKHQHILMVARALMF